MLTLTDVAVSGPDEVLLASVVDDYSDENPDHCMLLRYSAGGFKQRLLDHAVARVVVDPGVEGSACFLGTGPISTFKGPQGFFTEVVDGSDDGPSSRLLMRDACWFERRLVACGMARMVYERLAPDRWRRIDQDVFLTREKRDRAVGFHAMTVGPGNRLFFAGQYGEIWRLEQRQWVQESSPTNVALTDLTKLEGGRMIATGMAGTVLLYDGQGWRALDTSVSDDFWSVCEFLGTVFIATSKCVYRLAGDVSLVPSLPDVSAARLASGFGQLWSVGSSAAHISRDGQKWTAVPLPEGS